MYTKLPALDEVEARAVAVLGKRDDPAAPRVICVGADACTVEAVLARDVAFEASNPGREAERGKAVEVLLPNFGVGGAIRIFLRPFIGEPVWNASSSVAAVLFAVSVPAVAIRFLGDKMSVRVAGQILVYAPLFYGAVYLVIRLSH